MQNKIKHNTNTDDRIQLKLFFKQKNIIACKWGQNTNQIVKVWIQTLKQLVLNIPRNRLPGWIIVPLEILFGSHNS